MPGDLVGEHADVVDDRPQFLRDPIHVGGGLGEFFVDQWVADQPPERALRVVELPCERDGLGKHLVEPADRGVEPAHHLLAPLA